MFDVMTEAERAQHEAEKAWWEEQQRLEEEYDKGKPGFAEYFRWIDEMVDDPNFNEPYAD